VSKLSWHRIKFVSWNFGPGRLEDLLNLMAFAFIIFLQEAGDRAQEIADALHVEKNWKEITGVQPGQSSTPLLYDNGQLILLQISRILLAHAQDAGPGTGPRRIKEKWLIGGQFQDRTTGRKFWAYSVHFVTSQGERKRHLIALAMANRISLRIRSLTQAIFIGGDWNNEETSDVMQSILRIRGMKATAALPSHENRAIDRIIWRIRRWIRLMRTSTEETGSDHRAVVGHFEFKMKRRRA
jgi:endonuclease/exonuclease/phosphatase family metal-dependent hydrolase